MIERADRFLGARSAGETFEQAIARANAWLASVLDSESSESLLLEWGKDFDGVHASTPVAVKVAEIPAHIAEVAMFETWLGARLPASYRRFLTTVGQVTFLHRPLHPTYPIGTLKSVTEIYREMLDEWFEGYDDEVFGRDWTKASEESGGYTSWREWPKWTGVFHPDEVRNRNFLPICPGFEEDAHLMALHLAEPDAEAPIFQNYPDDGAAFFLRGASFDAWMGSMVDEMIRMSPPRSGRTSL
jgi:predicted RNase H-like HicB family nuclease